MRDSTWPENGPDGRWDISLIWKTLPMHDFANFGSLISEIVTGARFRLLGKRGRCAISLIWQSWPMRDFNGPETEPLGGYRFHLFGKRGRCAISLLLEIAGDARFHLVAKRNNWMCGDITYLEDVGDARFR